MSTDENSSSQGWIHFNLETAVGSQKSAKAQGACPRLDGSTAGALDVARSSDPFRGRLKKAASLRQGYGRQASCVPSLRRASFAEVATKAESGFAQAGRLLVYSRTPCTLRAPKALRPCWTTPRLREGMLFEQSPFSLHGPTIRLK